MLSEHFLTCKPKNIGGLSRQNAVACGVLILLNGSLLNFNHEKKSLGRIYREYRKRKFLAKVKSAIRAGNENEDSGDVSFDDMKIKRIPKN